MQENDKKPKIFVATPMYGGMCAGFYTQSIIQLLTTCQANGVDVEYSFMFNESLITRARNSLTHTFMQTDCSHLMFIDADINFRASDVIHMIRADKDILCGIYPKKEVDWARVEKAAKDGKEGLQDYAGSFVFNMIGTGHAETDPEGMIEVRHAGTGFMLIKRGVFEHLKPHVPTYRVASFKDENGEYVKPLTHEFFATSIDSTGALLSEDYHFCDLWRKHGGKIHANPFVKLEHVGTYVYGGDMIKSGGNLK